MSHERNGRRTPWAAQEAGRALIRQACRADLSKYELRVVLAVIDQLSLFDRVADHVATKAIADVAGISQRQAARLLAKLADRGLELAYVPGKYKGHAAWLGLGKESQAALIVSALIAATGGRPNDGQSGQIGPQSGHIGGPKRTSPAAAMSNSEVPKIPGAHTPEGEDKRPVRGIDATEERMIAERLARESSDQGEPPELAGGSIVEYIRKAKANVRRSG